MMATEKRVTFSAKGATGDPTVVVTITGWHDAFRFAWAMGHLQCDFADVGRRIGGSLRKHIGAQRFREMHQHFTGNQTIAWARQDPPDEEDSAVADAVAKDATLSAVRAVLDRYYRSVDAPFAADVPEGDKPFINRTIAFQSLYDIRTIVGWQEQR